MERIMKKKEQMNVQATPVMNAVPVEVVRPTEFVVNCHKCGAALTMKSGKAACLR